MKNKWNYVKKSKTIKWNFLMFLLLQFGYISISLAAEQCQNLFSYETNTSELVIKKLEDRSEQAILQFYYLSEKENTNYRVPVVQYDVAAKLFYDPKSVPLDMAFFLAQDKNVSNSDPASFLHQGQLKAQQKVIRDLLGTGKFPEEVEGEILKKFARDGVLPEEDALLYIILIKASMSQRDGFDFHQYLKNLPNKRGINHIEKITELLARNIEFLNEEN